MLKKVSRTGQRLPGNAGEGAVPPIAIILLVAIALLVGANVYSFLEIRGLRGEVAERLVIVDERLAMLDGSVERTSSQLDSKVGEVKNLVAAAEKELDQRARQAESHVLGRTNSLEKRLDESSAEHQARIAAVGGRLEEFEADTESKVGSLDGRVTDVKKEVDSTKAELEKTIAELTSVRGDLGVQSGLIATNGGELAALRALGDRDYYEFDMGKTKQPQKVGPIRIRLTGSDMKRNRFSIELWADDKKIEKRRKTLLEPVQFYVMGSRIPYELVINKIEKDVIAGYLATPKQAPRGSGGSTE